MRVLAFIFVTLSCSSAGVDVDDDVVVNPALEIADVPYSAEKDGIAPCGMQVNPDLEILDFVLEAQERWFTATGCMVEIDPEGIPMHAQDHVFLDYDRHTVYAVDPESQYREVCGVTRRNNDVSAKDIYISWTDRGNCQVALTVAHELGHVWSPPGQHADSGLMAAGKDPDKAFVIDATTLAWTCQKLDCQTFNPEVAP